MPLPAHLKEKRLLYGSQSSAGSQAGSRPQSASSEGPADPSAVVNKLARASISRASSLESLCSQPTGPNKHTSQIHFQERDQTAIVFDFDDTLFPTTFVDQLSSAFEKGSLSEKDLKDFMDKIESCQATAEALLESALSLGSVIIVTLCSRGLLKKRCETWYPKVWKLMVDESKVVYARESQAFSDESNKQSKEESQELQYWAFVKGSVIEQELENFYSQYQGQSWKNIVSIGDSNIERYGTLGATNAYVQKRFSGTSRAHQTITEKKAYATIWESFDNGDHKWRDGLEGVYDGHIFKVRTKIVKMLDEPTPAELSEQQIMLTKWLPRIINYDGSLNLVINDLKEARTMSELSGDDNVHLAMTARVGSSSLEFTNVPVGGLKAPEGQRPAGRPGSGRPKRPTVERTSTKETL